MHQAHFGIVSAFALILFSGGAVRLEPARVIHAWRDFCEFSLASTNEKMLIEHACSIFGFKIALSSLSLASTRFKFSMITMLQVFAWLGKSYSFIDMMTSVL